MNNKHQLLMDFLLCSGFWGVWGGGLDIGYAASEVGGGGQEARPGPGGRDSGAAHQHRVLQVGLLGGRRGAGGRALLVFE